MDIHDHTNETPKTFDPYSSAPYSELSARYGFPKSKLLPLILRKIVNPEQAKILLQFPAESSSAIADKLGLTQDIVDQHLQEMFEKGIALQTKKGWRMARMIDSLHDLTLCNKKYHESYGGDEYYDLWNIFGQTEWWPRFAHHIREHGEPFMRVIPAVEAVKDIPDLLPEEDLRQLYKSTTSIALIPCSCRVEIRDRECKSPDDMCIAVNRSAEYHFKRGVGKRLSPEEAVEFDKTVRKYNSVAVMPNTRDLNMVICNCHECCCVGFRAFSENGGNLRELHAPSRFLAIVDTDKCIGCQKCLEACNYEAVELQKYPGMKKWKAYIAPDKCMGCGNCVVKCPKNVISFKIVRPPEYILGCDDHVNIYDYEKSK
jgi:Na+-translocating ferredoxin:NAD+ oxidoreductase subunit B